MTFKGRGAKSITSANCYNTIDNEVNDSNAKNSYRAKSAVRGAT
eukprot:CAMPEP_0176340144 /NCGR_PEP_ID=MMETSP0126-20121128/1338_1 /TAXON_ID=141414 ORGANISM="Strombidinopsis acuminatum, Strain SPMC142" /NCGR_SAMPLE_ID=MMETSP0126 /ASSEMBLY_ACC=CAM_ASM_000229 /LENGTH=43 /DNA_ID= /DNA_START= /DNA_END= /DNA_ORIENTATION=